MNETETHVNSAPSPSPPKANKKKLKLKKTREMLRNNRRQQSFLSNLNLKSSNCSVDCYPQLGDLLIGRKNFLYSTSTCGIPYPERYCRVGTLRPSHISDSNGVAAYLALFQKRISNCQMCHSAQPYDEHTNYQSHRIENVINDHYLYADHHRKSSGGEKWWQSANGQEKVLIQFDLEGEFTMTHLLIKFKSYPPAEMIIEKSADFGRQWRPLAYYAENCDEAFPFVSKQSKDLNEPFCTERYSRLDMLDYNGELVYAPLKRYKHAEFIDQTILQDMLKITNLRFNLTKMHTFGDNLIEKYDEADSIYYYAISQIRVLGTCFCNGHASRCVKADRVQYDEHSLKHMVHSQCACEHNTEGVNCERCMPLYNDRKWSPARNGFANECKRCECNSHSARCVYDEERFLQTNGQSGGVCVDCQHNTEGVNCERCKFNHYRDTSLPMTHPLACKGLYLYLSCFLSISFLSIPLFFSFFFLFYLNQLTHTP
jgi:hypothetical protein